MTVQVMHDTDKGAPTIGNTIGDLTSLLDVLLVTGYPTQSITGLTRSGTTVTGTKTSHGYIVGNIISVSGAVEDEYNGNQTIATVPNADTFTYEITGTPATPATGTIIATYRPSQSITTLVSSGLTATATKVAHGYATGNMIKISGANESAYNGNFKITISSADVFTYQMLSDPVDTATGTITASYGQNALGWQLAFTGTNIRSYRPRVGSRMYLGVDHTTNAYIARIRGFETMTAAGVAEASGTGPYPTDVQVSGGLYAQCTVNTAGNREWALVGDEKTMYFHVNIDAVTPYWSAFMFGDFDSFKSGDVYNSIIIGKNATAANSANEKFTLLPASTTGVFAAVALAGHYMPRAYTQAGTAVAAGKYSEGMRKGGTQMGGASTGSSNLNYPDLITGGFNLARMYVLEPGIGVRGMFRGMWDSMHNWATLLAGGAANGDTFAGSTGLNGLKFEIRACNTVSLPSASIVFEISDTW